MSDDLVKRLRAFARHPMMDNNCKADVFDVSESAARIEALTAERDALRAQVNAADELVRTVESLTGNIWSTPIPNALAAYRNARNSAHD